MAEIIESNDCKNNGSLTTSKSITSISCTKLPKRCGKSSYCYTTTTTAITSSTAAWRGSPNISHHNSNNSSPKKQKNKPLAWLFALLVRLFLTIVAAIRRPVIQRKASIAAKLKRKHTRCLRILPRKVWCWNFAKARTSMDAHRIIFDDFCGNSRQCSFCGYFRTVVLV